MASTLPPFGDISSILPEDTVIHEHNTVVIAQEVDTQETLFVPGNDNITITEKQTTRRSSQNASITDRDGPSQLMDTESLNEKELSGNGQSEEPDETQFDEGSDLQEDEDPDISGLGSEQDTGEENGQYQDSVEMHQSFNEELDSELATDENEPVPEDGAQEVIDLEDREALAPDKLFQLPISKIKRIMQTDPDTKLIAKDALAAVAISTEQFLSLLAQQSYKLAVRSKKKRITLEHVKSIIASSEACDFLEGTIPELDI